MKLKHSLFLFAFLLSKLLVSQTFNFNTNCTNAYKSIISLKLDEGKKLLETEKQCNPNNLIPIVLNNYIDFLSVFTSGSLQEYELVKKQIESRVSLLRKGDVNSPYYLYTQAEIHIQAAVLHIKFGEYFSCIFDIRKALKKLEENKNKYPNFIPNNKSLGMLYTILGSIPEQYQTGLEFIGLSGNVTNGLQLLKTCAESNNVFNHEAATIYAFMLLHIQNEPDIAWNYTQAKGFLPKSNLMDAYSLGHIGIYGTHNELGITALVNRPKSSNYTKFPMCDYLIGLGKTYKIDKDANVYFNYFLQENKGKDYIKSAYHKMAWNELLKGNTNGYKNYIKLAASQGRNVIDTDKQAEHEVNSGKIPNINLLKIRLLTDGNYLNKALELSKTFNVNSFSNLDDKTEYYYRIARLNDKLNQHTQAISYYKLTISNGKQSETYFAANAAYLLGFLYENINDNKNALFFYKQSLILNGYEYNNSIHQKAEAGLNRLNQ